PELRKIAIEGLPEKSLKSKELMKIMEDILFNDSDSGLQKTAIYSLSRGGNPETITLLANVISNHKDPDIRKTALYSIPEARTYQIAFPVLSDIIFKGNDEELQKAALYTVMRLNNKESKQLIANVITDHKNPALKIAALHAITAKNINDELVLNLENIIVKSSNEELRRAALLSIMRYDKDRYIQLLIRMIEAKKDDELILYAAQFLPGALGALPGKATKTTVDFLEDLIFDKSRFSDRKSSLREQTIYMLEGMKGDKSLDLLIKIAKTHEDTKIRKAAVMALGRSKNPKAKKALLEIIKKR
ncbi:MAG: HEAT repeat domain-containing protein, partial [bacterium]|nr:HEAT repeat domain-containing protein [bacterium]